MIYLSGRGWACDLIVLLAALAWSPVLPADEYVERISSFETDAETFMFTYHAEGKGRAQATDQRSSDGHRSLKLDFMATEAAIFSKSETGTLAAAAGALVRSFGFSTKEGDGGALAQLGRSTDILPFDWTSVDALAFDAYNPTIFPLELSLKVKSGWHDSDPEAKVYRTQVTLPPREWTVVRLSRQEMNARCGVLRTSRLSSRRICA